MKERTYIGDVATDIETGSFEFFIHYNINDVLFNWCMRDGKLSHHLISAAAKDAIAAMDARGIETTGWELEDGGVEVVEQYLRSYAYLVTIQMRLRK